MSSAIPQAAIAIIIAWGVAFGILRPLIRPRGNILTRDDRGRQFAANALAITFAVTCSRAITGQGEKNLVIAVAVLPPLIALAAYGVGWLTGPPSATRKAATPGLSGDRAYAEPQTDPAKATPELNADSIQATDQIYEQIADEIDSGNIQRGVWTRIYAECEGDESRTKVAYIRYRAATLLKTDSGDNTGIKTADTQATTSLESEHSTKPEMPACATDEQLADLLCKQILEDPPNPKIESTLEKLRNQGFDIDTIEMLVADRLGPEGGEKLSLHLSR